MLAKLTAPMESTTAAQAFAAYIPMLSDFPDEAFCPTSLDAVATQCGYAPSLAGALRKALGERWKQHRPPSAAIEAPPPPKPRIPPDDFERAAVSRSVREILTGFSEVTRQREAQLPQHITRPLPQFSRELLANEMYRQAGFGLNGPEVPSRLLRRRRRHPRRGQARPTGMTPVRSKRSNSPTWSPRFSTTSAAATPTMPSASPSGSPPTPSDAGPRAPPHPAFATCVDRHPPRHRPRKPRLMPGYDDDLRTPGPLEQLIAAIENYIDVVQANPHRRRLAGLPTGIAFREAQSAPPG